MMTLKTISRAALCLTFILALGLAWPGSGLAVQHHVLPLEVDSSTADRTDAPVDAAIDLTAFLGLIGGSLDLESFQVVEVDAAGSLLDAGVLFQFDPAQGFDPTTEAAGTLVFIMAGETPAATTRHFHLRFDVEGGCPDCPAPPVVPNPVTVDSLTYENQLTYVVDTPRAVYKYHTEGAGLASMIDGAGQDWIGFHDIVGSKTAGEYRGIPNLVFKVNQPQNSYFHPGFTNAHSRIVGAGPLKVTVFSETDDPDNLWQVLWEFYPEYARMTVQTVGTTNEGSYWFLYEGTVNGLMDEDAVVVRSDGTQTSAFSYGEVWEEILPNPTWAYFRNLNLPRILYVADDMGDGDLDSYRPQGQTSGSTPQMTVFGFGRVLNTTSNSLVPRMSGTGRTFTLGFGEDYSTADADIAGASKPMIVTLGTPDSGVSAVDEADVPAAGVFQRNYPNPFNPRTRIAFTLPASSRVRLDVLDVQGRLVTTLVDGVLSAGDHAVPFEGKDLPSGMYISRLTTERGSDEHKMMLVR